MPSVIGQSFFREIGQLENRVFFVRIIPNNFLYRFVHLALIQLHLAGFVARAAVLTPSAGDPPRAFLGAYANLIPAVSKVANFAGFRGAANTSSLARPRMPSL
jgi:hypothetical protein